MKFLFSINLDTQKEYDCVKGVSDNWANEVHNIGPGIGQVIAEIAPDERVSKDECRITCENNGASAFNWKENQNLQGSGCRCYGEQAAGSIKIDNKFNWMFCKHSGKFIGIDNS